MEIRKPKEIHDAALEAGCAKIAIYQQSPLRTVVLAVVAGAYIALGGMLSVIIGYGFPEASAANPALQRMMSGLVFPVALLIIVVSGAELFTGNAALLVPGIRHRRFGLGPVAGNLFIVWVFNFVGALIFVAMFVLGAGMLDSQPWADSIRAVAEAKVGMDWWTVFIRGIGANWCVCLAVWLALSSRTLGGKVLGCWIPVFAFVALGFEHCIANMFFIPAGMAVGADVTVGQLVVTNLIPATLGNLIGGALLVGMLSTWRHGRSAKCAE